MNLTLEQIVALLQQLRPQEREWVWCTVAPQPWQQRVDVLLAQVWQRLEREPLSETDSAAEIKRARADYL